jgi:AbrB family looped-hinge helix DNA binding protein
MIRKITRNKQVTLPKVFLDRLQLSEGDYVDIDCENDTIRLRQARMETFDENDYAKLAAKLDKLKKESCTSCDTSEDVRCHLKKLMKQNADQV